MTVTPYVGPTGRLAYVPVDLAEGTGIAEDALVVEGLLRRLAGRRGVQFDHATQRISARPATAEESRLLEVGRRECMLTVLIAVYDRSRRAVLCLDAVLPPGAPRTRGLVPRRGVAAVPPAGGQVPALDVRFRTV